MKYTTSKYRFDSSTRVIEVFKPEEVTDRELYIVAKRLWVKYTEFCCIPFPFVDCQYPLSDTIIEQLKSGVVIDEQT